MAARSAARNFESILPSTSPRSTRRPKKREKAVPSRLSRRSVSPEKTSERCKCRYRVSISAEHILLSGCRDIDTPQNGKQREDKSKGLAPRGYLASASHFKVASHRSCPRCMSVSSLLRRPAASFPTPASSITTWHMAPRGSRYQE